MKPIVLSIVLLLTFALPASAQVLSFGAGADVTFPSSDLKDNVATGYGLTALAKFGLIPLIDLTGGVEYIKFTDKDITVNNLTATGNGSAFGIVLGGRVNVLAIAYAGLETGTYSFSKTAGSETTNITRGFLGPMVGVKLSMFDICARYVSADKDSFWGLRGLIWF